MFPVVFISDLLCQVFYRENHDLRTTSNWIDRGSDSCECAQKINLVLVPMGEEMKRSTLSCKRVC